LICYSEYSTFDEEEAAGSKRKRGLAELIGTVQAETRRFRIQQTFAVHLPATDRNSQ
jgi:hypothetical protein